MLSVAEALEKVLENVQTKASVKVPVSESLGLILAENVAADLDSPPFDKSLRDGYVISEKDLNTGTKTFQILEEITAGNLPKKPILPGTVCSIMTGAPIPVSGAAVIMFEDAVSLEANQVTINQGTITQVSLNTADVKLGQWILKQGAAMQQGETVLHAGITIRSIEVGLLSEVGKTEVQVIPKATVTMLPTGDEIVPPNLLPQAGQIRNSNGPMIETAIQKTGSIVIKSEIGKDNVDHLRTLIDRGLQQDVLLLSGGVSEGTKDLVPQVLAELGVEQVFHKVNLKPGKPLWFGVKQSPTGNKLVFGLPGNPVSTLVCFELFVKPALRKLQGHSCSTNEQRTLPLSNAFKHFGNRPTYHPGKVHSSNEAQQVEALKWAGSPDLYGISAADVLICFPLGDHQYSVGDEVKVIPLS